MIVPFPGGYHFPKAHLPRGFRWGNCCLQMSKTSINRSFHGSPWWIYRWNPVITSKCQKSQQIVVSKPSEPEMFRGFWVDSLTIHHHLRWLPSAVNGRYNLSRKIMALSRSWDQFFPEVFHHVLFGKLRKVLSLDLRLFGGAKIFPKW